MSSLALVEQAIYGDRLVTYLAVSSGVLVMYDYLITLSEEAELLWNTPWNRSKILFYLNRYLVFFDVILIFYHQFGRNMSVETCNRVYHASTIMIEIGIFIAEATLVIRTWALWGRSKYIAGILLVVVVGCSTLSIVYIAKYLGTLSFIPVTAISPSLSGCLVSIEKDHTLWLSFLALAIFETAILILTLGTRINRIHQPLSVLAQMMYKDGFIYFVYLFATSTTNVVLFLHAPLLYALMLIPLQRVLHGMLCSRILLNLRKYGHTSAHTYNSEASTAGVIGGPHTLPSGIRIHRVTEVSGGLGSKDQEEYELRPQAVRDIKYDLERNPGTYDSFLDRN